MNSEISVECGLCGVLTLRSVFDIDRVVFKYSSCRLLIIREKEKEKEPTVFWCAPGLKAERGFFPEEGQKNAQNSQCSCCYVKNPGSLFFPMLPLRQRITKKEEFEHVFRSKKTIRAQSPLFTLYVVPSEEINSRFGFVVGTKVSKKATARNKLKRRMRAAVARAIPAIKKRVDAVLVARSQGEKATFQEIEKTITNLLHTARLIRADQ